MFDQAFIIAVASTLNPLLLALMEGTGAAIGELTGTPWVSMGKTIGRIALAYLGILSVNWVDATCSGS